MMDIKITGLKELEKRLSDLSRKADKIARTKSIEFRDLFPDSLISRTTASSIARGHSCRSLPAHQDERGKRMARGFQYEAPHRK